MGPDPLIFIVEAPGAADLFDGRTEGEALNRGLALLGMPHGYRMATDMSQLKRALSLDPADGGLGQAMVNHGPPVVHLSMHGNADGVALTSGEFVEWHQLREFLTPINERLPQGVLVCMSSCMGYAGIRMSMHLDGTKPLYGVVGTSGNVAWAESLVAFLSFYQRWRTSVLPDAVRAMDVASGHNGFTFQAGNDTKREYMDYVSKRIAPPRIPVPAVGIHPALPDPVSPVGRVP